MEPGQVQGLSDNVIISKYASDLECSFQQYLVLDLKVFQVSDQSLPLAQTLAPRGELFVLWIA